MSQLQDLVALIASATKTVEAEYAKKGYKVPDLDSTEPHPYDAEPSSEELRKAIQILEGACNQLCATAARPGHTLANVSMEFYEVQCLYIATQAKIADHLKGAPGGLHVSELSKKSGIEQSKLARILRLLATKHCFREVSPNVFANNRLSVTLQSDNALTALYGHEGDESYKSAGRLYENLTDPVSGPSFTVENSACVRAHGVTLFEYFSKNPQAGERFGRSLIGWGTAIEAATLLFNFPWKDLPAGTTVCDVGGGVGNVTLQLAKAFPQLKLKLQDSEAVLEQAKGIWQKECPEAIKEQRIEFKTLDFFKEGPIAGCDIYYLKHIIHDWPDQENVKILKNIKSVMKDSSRILIDEYILQLAARTSESSFSVTQAPEPLLPNYGAGSIRQYNLDLQMMNNLNSKERTVEEFAQLAKDAGLKFVKIWELGETGLVEYSK